MKIEANDPEEYLEKVQESHKFPLSKLRKVILENLPAGFEETMNYGMIGYVVPHQIYPSGYHCDSSLPLPFISIASQKNFIGFYHMGLYADKEMHDWFLASYPSYSSRKLDMGKSCIRFKHLDDIPYELLGKLVEKMSPLQWIALYESALKR